MWQAIGTIFSALLSIGMLLVIWNVFKNAIKAAKGNRRRARIASTDPGPEGRRARSRQRIGMRLDEQIRKAAIYDDDSSDNPHQWGGRSED
jgi:hypothetical protein